MSDLSYVMSSVLLGGKSLKELGFPQDWKYDFNLHQWTSDKHTITREICGKPETKIKEYLPITDEMLSKLRRVI